MRKPIVEPGHVIFDARAYRVDSINLKERNYTTIWIAADGIRDFVLETSSPGQEEQLFQWLKEVKPEQKFQIEIRKVTEHGDYK